jgi:Flp pilus assembly protein TadG
MLRVLSRARVRDERGVALTEFALVLPVLMLLFLGMLDLGKAFNYWIDTTHLANKGARWAAVDSNPGACQVPAQSLQQYIREAADTDELREGGTINIASPLQVEILRAAGTNVGQPVEVRVTTTYSFLPFVGEKIGILTHTISGTASMRMEQVGTSYEDGFGGAAMGICP